jgi:hypothetical protein
MTDTLNNFQFLVQGSGLFFQFCEVKKVTTDVQNDTIALENQKPPKKKLQKSCFLSAKTCIQKKKVPENSENHILKKLYSL